MREPESARGEGRDPSPRRGFTLVELLVVVLIIGTLTAIALPQYVRVVERSRLSEAENFLSAVAQAQERQLGRTGFYATAGAAAIATLDLDFPNPGGLNSYGMRFFNVTGLAAIADCGGAGGLVGAPGYNLTLTRVDRPPDGAALSNRYGGFTTAFNSCSNLRTYNNANATADFPAQ